MTRIAVVAGSTRTGRLADRVAEWTAEVARAHVDPDVEVTLVDLADQGLPLLDEPVPAMAGRYAHEHTRRWSATVAGFDGFVFVVGEHNHSFPASLKNALDHLYAEWNDKAAGFVEYGVAGGQRGVEQLRAVLAELRVATVRSHGTLTLGDDIAVGEHVEPTVAPSGHQTGQVRHMLDELVSWSRALETVRAPHAGERPGRSA